MQQKKTPSKSFYFYILLAALLLLFSWFFLLRNMAAYKNSVQTAQNQSLERIAEAVDHTIASVYDEYRDDLNYTLSSSNFIAARDHYLDTGETDALFSCMAKSLPAMKISTKAMLVCKDGDVICSTDRNGEYHLPDLSACSGEMQVRICSDYNNRLYLGFFQKRSSFCIGVLTYLEDFYTEVEKNSGLLSVGELLLLDAEQTIFMHRDDAFQAEVPESDSQDPLVQVMLQASRLQTRSTRNLSEQNGDAAEKAYTRVSVYPASVNSNQTFSIGVLYDSHSEMKALKKSNIELFILAELIFVGVLLLFLLIYNLYSQKEKTQREVEILREKKEAMEALNQETLEFAHHQRLETIGQLTSGIAHDFNNLLTPIMGYSLMVMEKLPPEDVESYDNLLEVYNASKKAKDLISRLSDLSRKNSEATMQLFDPDAMIRNAVTIAESSKQKNVALEVETDCRGAQLYGNEIQFSQMMLNLLINAFHALEPDGGLVQVSCSEKEGRIVIRVADNGQGIPEEIQEKIFQPFFTTKSFNKGTGLGLAIVQQVVEEYKGTIELNSRPGEGTQFKISFPAEK